MLKKVLARKQAEGVRVAEIGLMARRGLVAVAGAAVAAGLLSVALAELQPASREPAVVFQTGQALKHRPSAAELSEALGAFERFRDQPDEAAAVTGQGQRLALSEARH